MPSPDIPALAPAWRIIVKSEHNTSRDRADKGELLTAELYSAASESTSESSSAEASDIKRGLDHDGPLAMLSSSNAK